MKFFCFSGIHVDVIRFDTEVSEDSLVKKISELNHDTKSDAILLQVRNNLIFLLTNNVFYWLTIKHLRSCTVAFTQSC